MSESPGILTLEVGDLPAPEPYQQIRKSLTQMDPGSCLIVSHRREPVPLYTFLAASGLHKRVVRPKDREGLFLLIWHGSDQSTGEFCMAWTPE